MKTPLIKLALNALKAHKLAKEVGLIPEPDSAWKGALKHLRDSKGNALKGEALAKKRVELGDLSNNGYQKIVSKTRKLALDTEMAGTVGEKGVTTSHEVGALRRSSVSLREGMNFHTHPAPNHKLIPSNSTVVYRNKGGPHRAATPSGYELTHPTTREQIKKNISFQQRISSATKPQRENMKALLAKHIETYSHRVKRYKALHDTLEDRNSKAKRLRDLAHRSRLKAVSTLNEDKYTHYNNRASKLHDASMDEYERNVRLRDLSHKAYERAIEAKNKAISTFQKKYTSDASHNIYMKLLTRPDEMSDVSAWHGVAKGTTQRIIAPHANTVSVSKVAPKLSPRPLKVVYFDHTPRKLEKKAILGSALTALGVHALQNTVTDNVLLKSKLGSKKFGNALHKAFTAGSHGSEATSSKVIAGISGAVLPEYHAALVEANKLGHKNKSPLSARQTLALHHIVHGNLDKGVRLLGKETDSSGHAILKAVGIDPHHLLRASKKELGEASASIRTNPVLNPIREALSKENIRKTHSLSQYHGSATAAVLGSLGSFALEPVAGASNVVKSIYTHPTLGKNKVVGQIKHLINKYYHHSFKSSIDKGKSGLKNKGRLLGRYGVNPVTQRFEDLSNDLARAWKKPKS